MVRTYRVSSLNVSGSANRIYYSGQTVREDNFAPGVAEKLADAGHLARLFETATDAEVKVGVLIITRGDRPKFLMLARLMLSRQTRIPDYVHVMCEPPKSDAPDITYRYQKGFDYLYKCGATVVVCWEDDDYYAPNYLQNLLLNWRADKQPLLYGYHRTVYYHLTEKKYLQINHPGRASMCCTLLTKQGFDLMAGHWPPPTEKYLDEHLWRALAAHSRTCCPLQVNGGTYLHIGIKHGQGLCGGGGHTTHWHRYNEVDTDGSFLATQTGLADSYRGREQWPALAGIYRAMAQGATRYPYHYEVKSYATGVPFLTFVTRCYKRPKGLNQNQQSMAMLAKHDADFEQILLHDEVGYGMLAANRSFALVSGHISGDYVHLLDDDDFIINPRMVTELREIAERENYPDVIFFRFIIKTGSWNDHYPTPDVWGKSEMKFAHIGGGCWVVRADIYRRYIQHFGHPKGGDYQFISRLMADKPTVYWHDVVMGETGKVSRGKAEV